MPVIDALNLDALAPTTLLTACGKNLEYQKCKQGPKYKVPVSMRLIFLLISILSFFSMTIIEHINTLLSDQIT